MNNQATMKCRIYFKENDSQIKYSDITAEWGRSGAFNYGNGSAVVIKDVTDKGVSGMPRHIDTRYVIECATESGFREWIIEELKAYYGDNVDRIEVVA